MGGADRIETCIVGGWEVVCKKDEFKIGELVVYIEIDSMEISFTSFATIANVELTSGEELRNIPVEFKSKQTK